MVVIAAAERSGATFVWTTFVFWNADWMNYLPLRMDGRDLFMFAHTMVRNESERNATSSLSV